MLLSEHLHQVGLPDIDHPFHVLGGIEPHLLESLGDIVLVDAAERGDADPLALELGKIGHGVNALLVQLRRDIDHGVTAARPVVAPVQDHHQRSSLLNTVEQAGRRREIGDVELSRDHRGHRHGAVDVTLGLDGDAHLLEVAFLARNKESAAGYERTISDANEICGRGGIPTARRFEKSHEHESDDG